MNTKSKGTSGERELIHLFWKSGWAAFRAAGSGSMRYPCPDLIAGNALRRMGIECKMSKLPYKHIMTREIEELKEFCRIFGAESWVAVKFQKMGWFFLTLEDIRQTEKGFVITEEIARNKGLIFEELTK